MASRHIRITFPWPEPVLFPNARMGKHWRSYQQAKTIARLDGALAARAAVGRERRELSSPTPIRITFMQPDRRKRDWDGMAGAIKHHIDGMAQVLGVDDSIFRPVTIDVGHDEEKKGFVVVEIEA